MSFRKPPARIHMYGQRANDGCNIASLAHLWFLLPDPLDLPGGAEGI